MKKLAISYMRYSSGKQAKGSSYDRQKETEAYCLTHGLTLIDRLEDLGVSGWTGANLEDTAALGGFLKEAEQGKIPKGTTLSTRRLDQKYTKLRANKRVTHGLLSAGGLCRFLIICGQTTDTEAQILFKVMEYKTKHNVTMQGLLAFKDEQELVPIHPSRIPDMNDKLKAQLQAGISNLTVRIQGAIGLARAVQPIPAK